jgi:Asp-tRNA(Asn)/Glu-tRNA(Gln) amidotransferase A subunit family amidase
MGALVEDLCAIDAVTLAGMLRRREVSAREVIAAHIARIEALDGAVNAVVTRCFDTALAKAADADAALARGESTGLPGRVPGWPFSDVADVFGVDGPMARTVAGVALLLMVLSGPDPRVPLALDAAPPVAEPDQIAGLLERDLRGVRVAWSADLGLPVEPAVRETLAPARQLLAGLGCEVADAAPRTYPAPTLSSGPGGRSGSRPTSARCFASIPGRSGRT